MLFTGLFALQLTEEFVLVETSLSITSPGRNCRTQNISRSFGSSSGNEEHRVLSPLLPLRTLLYEWQRWFLMLGQIFNLRFICPYFCLLKCRSLFFWITSKPHNPFIHSRGSLSVLQRQQVLTGGPGFPVMPGTPLSPWWPMGPGCPGIPGAPAVPLGPWTPFGPSSPLLPGCREE